MQDFRGKRYYSFSQFLQEKYNEKVWKISVDAGFSCPNRDGHKGRDGCIFCRMDSFSRMASLQKIDVASQVQSGIEQASAKLGIKKFIVYFQTSTNTYASVNILDDFFKCAISFPGVVGLSISTRPDCLSQQILDLIESFTHRVDVWVELGLQTSHDETLQRINRGHTFTDYLNAVNMLKKVPIRICTHLMLGLPGESRKHVLETAEKISQLDIHEIKIHPLLILQRTPLEKMYSDGHFAALELSEYAQLTCDVIERMNPQIVIQRLTAEAPHRMLIAPLWAKNKHEVRANIEKELVRRDSFQGKYFIKR